MKDLSMEKFDQMNVKNENINVNDIIKNFIQMSCLKREYMVL